MMMFYLNTTLMVLQQGITLLGGVIEIISSDCKKNNK